MKLSRYTFCPICKVDVGCLLGLLGLLELGIVNVVSSTVYLVGHYHRHDHRHDTCSNE